MEEMMTIADASLALGVSVDTLRTWALSGRLKGSKFTTAHGRIVPRAEVERLIRGRDAAAEVGVTAWAPELPPRESPTFSPQRKHGADV